MTFYQNTKIETWQSKERCALRLAFQESRKRHTVSRPDLELPKMRFRDDLLAVNSFSRKVWGEIVSDKLSDSFCNGGDGTTHNQEIYFVSLMDINCARSPDDNLTDADLLFIKDRLRYGLRKFSYFGMIEPAYYENLQYGVRYNGKRCMFWHLHALVWGVTPKELKKHLRKVVKAGRYRAIADGMDATHCRRIKQGRLPAHVAYMLKSPSKTYRISVKDRQLESGQPFADADGVVLREFKQGKSDLGHGDRIMLFHSMKHLYLDQLTVAGGEGAKMLRTMTYFARKRRTSLARSLEKCSRPARSLRSAWHSPKGRRRRYQQ
jgi:hypothetical protein